MKKIIFIAILGIVSNSPSYASAGGHGSSQGVAGRGASHGAGHGGAVGSQMIAIPHSSIANNAVTPSQRKKKGQTGTYVEDAKVTQSRIDWQQKQQAAALRTAQR